MNVRIRVGRRTVTVMPTRWIQGNNAAVRSTRLRAVRACSLVFATAAGCSLPLTAGGSSMARPGLEPEATPEGEGGPRFGPGEPGWRDPDSNPEANPEGERGPRFEPG